MRKTTTHKYVTGFASILLVIGLSGCSDNDDDDNADLDTTLRDNYTEQFAALPTAAVYPDDNPYSAEKEQLGELLFWDPILSGDERVACASCHHPDHGWADGRQLSMGVNGFGLGPDRQGGEETDIHAPTIMNTAFTGLTLEHLLDDESFVSGPYFWDLRAATLEAQAIGPIKNSIEMRGTNYTEDEIIPEIILRLETNIEYATLFEEAFGEDSITEENIARAIATFQRGIIQSQSRFDQFLNGDTSVFSEEEIGGLNKFIDVGCADCHDGPMLSDNEIDATKVVVPELEAVRTPSLRNISKTAPYMQDGHRSTLSNAVAIYEDREDLEVNMDDEDISAIVAFLLTLDSEVSTRIPEEVPSGLQVGGDI